MSPREKRTIRFDETVFAHLVHSMNLFYSPASVCWFIVKSIRSDFFNKNIIVGHNFDIATFLDKIYKNVGVFLIEKESFSKHRLMFFQ